MATTARRYIEIELEAGKALRQLGKIEQHTGRAEKQISRMRKSVSSLGIQLRAMVGYFGFRELIQFSDRAKDVEARLRAVTGSVQGGEQAFEDLLTMGNRLGIGINELASSYTKLGTAVPTASHERLLLALDTMGTTLATTGASVQQVNAVLLQMSQALGSGALQGDEFRSVAENAPVLLRAWREALGLTNLGFRELSAGAYLTTQSFFELGEEIFTLTKEMTGMSEPPLTVSRALVQLSNNFTDLIGNAEDTIPAFGAIASAIVLIANNLETLVQVVISATAAFVAFKAALVIGGALSAMTAGLAGATTAVGVLTGALKGLLAFLGPAGWIALAVGAMTYAVIEYWEDLRKIVDNTDLIFKAVYDRIKYWMEQAHFAVVEGVRAMYGALQGLVHEFSSAFGALGDQVAASGLPGSETMAEGLRAVAMAGVEAQVGLGKAAQGVKDYSSKVEEARKKAELSAATAAEAVNPTGPPDLRGPGALAIPSGDLPGGSGAGGGGGGGGGGGRGGGRGGGAAAAARNMEGWPASRSVCGRTTSAWSKPRTPWSR